MHGSSVELLGMVVFVLVFLVISGIGSLLALRAYGDERRVRSRLRQLGDDSVNTPEEEGVSVWRSAVQRLGAVLMPKREKEAESLRSHLLAAGLYQPNTVKVLLGVKLALIVGLPVLLAFLPYALGLIGLRTAIMASAAASMLGIVAPGLWLGHRTAVRQRALRRGLPDALDMLVLCLEGGVSLGAGLQRIIDEIEDVHPFLGDELNIVQQTTQMGLSIGEAFKQFGQRSGLAEIRDLASVITQSERFGASLAKALRTHADNFRIDRQQRAEEQAQKAAVQVLFPMLICIFPAIFIVLLGPAMIQVAQMFQR